jgi:adenosylmethionine-8-amino-7-oxononanoate aminotransferase
MMNRNRMPTNDEVAEWDRRHVWHAFTQMTEYEPLLIERADGCTLYDTAGRVYLDGVSSLWCNVFGHREPRIDAAIKAQLDKVAHVTSLGLGNPTTAHLAKRLTDLAPAGLEHVFFSSDGSSAVEVALKMALQYQRQRATPKPEKTLYVALGDAYHGDTLGSVSVGGVARFHATFAPLLFPVTRLPVPTTYRLPEGVTSETACAFYLHQLREVLERDHERIAALVIEPLVQCAAGMITHPPGYLRGVRELTQQYDVLLICDEVAVGFGRTGTMFACEQEDVAPDLLCLAKGLTGGYLPMAATLATDEIYSAFQGTFAESRTFFHGHTYGGNQLAAAAALATLEIFEQDRALENLQPKIARFAELLARIAQLPIVGDVRQRGLIAGIELVRDRASKEPFPWEERHGQRICQRLLERGIWLRPLGNVIVIFPPLSITLEGLDRICLAVEDELKKESLTPSPQTPPSATRP